MPVFRNIALLLAVASSHGAVAVLGEPCPPATALGMTFNGAAACIDGRINLTPELAGIAGTAFTTSKFVDTTHYSFR